MGKNTKFGTGTGNFGTGRAMYADYTSTLVNVIGETPAGYILFSIQYFPNLSIEFPPRPRVLFCK